MDPQKIATYIALGYAVVSALSVIAKAASTTFPAAVWLARAADFLAAIALDVQKLAGVFGGQSGNGSSRRGFISARLLFFVSALSIVFGVACGIVRTVAPTAVPFAVCVGNDAVLGKSLVEMVQDCGGDLLAVLEALLKSTDPAVQASRAYGEAARMQAALAHLPARAQ